MDVGPEDGEHCVSRTILRTPVYSAEWTMVLFIKIGNDKKIRYAGVKVKILNLHVLSLKFCFDVQNIK